MIHNLTEIKELKQTVGQMAEYCPKFWAAATGRRYILPNYRCADYFNQEYLDHVFALFFWAYLGGDFGENPDPVIRSAYMCQTMAMQEKRPIYYLERELGEVLMRTELPLDLDPTELHWIRRQFRVMLPRDLLVIERDGVRQSVMFLDIAHSKANEFLTMDEVMEREVKLFARAERLARGKSLPQVDVRPVAKKTGIVISGQLTQSEPGVPGVHYGIIRPFQDMAIRELIRVGEAFQTTAPCDVDDDKLLMQMQHLAITILLFLAAIPLEYEAADQGEIRKIRIVNSRVIPGLFPAKFIGKQLYRPKHKVPISRDSTGRTLADHWVKGAWKRQPYGPKSSLRKLIWIEPYCTGELRLTAETPSR